MKLFQLGIYRLDDDAENVKLFGPFFTDSEDDLDTCQQVISGFNEDAAADPVPWCIAVFPAELETVSS